MSSGHISSDLRDRCDDGRDLSDKPFHSACYAPFGTFELDPRGYVLPCCMNSAYPLGNVAEERLLDIWRGRRAAVLRQAVESYDFNYGCGTCRWQIEHGKGAPQLRQYDRLPVNDREVPWPTEIGFCLSNVCNLECIHCNGEYSSRIRARVEHRPPLPSVYGEEFFEDLAAFLPHLQTARFVGGEPFMMRENFRVWQMLIDEGLRPDCFVTTNGTKYNDKIEHVLANLPIHIVLSMDSPHAERFEAIRRNADFAAVVENLDRFQAYCADVGTSLVINHCLMRDNWHEYGDMLRFAEARGIAVDTSTVFNEPFSLYKAPLEELREVVDTMESLTDQMRSELTLNFGVWESEVQQLRTSLDERQAGSEDTILVWDQTDGGFVPDSNEARAIRTASRSRPSRVLLRSRRERQERESVVAELGTWAGDRVAVLDLDHEGIVVTFDPRQGSFYGLDPRNVIGHHLDDCLEVLRHRLGPSLIVMDRHVSAARFDVLVGYTSAPPYEKNGTFLRLVALPAGGAEDGGWSVILASDEIYPPVPLDEPRSTEPFDSSTISPVPRGRLTPA